MSKLAIRRALISVSDKTGLIPFAKELRKLHIEILSTGGTLKALKDAGISATPVEEVTGFPEILEGRVKTLHPKIHGALLYRRDKKSHEKEAAKHGIGPIDLVVVNLYPFEEIVGTPTRGAQKSKKGRAQGPPLQRAIENIDIGGPSMLRSAAKNFKAVTAVCDPADYSRVLHDIKKNEGSVSEELRAELAGKVFERTSAYDRAISGFLQGRNGSHSGPEPKPLPARLDLLYRKAQDLRYGENPHQRAALYAPAGGNVKPPFAQLHGKQLSFNNLLDIEAAMDVMREFSEPAACVVKHNNPCGVAEGKSTAEALGLAIECDGMSAFGGILGINRSCDGETAREAVDRLKFFEVFVAPSFEPSALHILRERQNLRLIVTGPLGDGGPYDMKVLKNGLLLQDRDLPIRLHLAALRKTLKFVTKTVLEKSELDNLIFAWKCAKVVKSNAIVITQQRHTVGIGAGQMSRVDSVWVACQKAGWRTEGGILASDAFFPMPDSIEAASEHKIRAIIQPGGSVRDSDVIAACDRFGIAMVFTGERHFRH